METYSVSECSDLPLSAHPHAIAAECAVVPMSGRLCAIQMPTMQTVPTLPTTIRRRVT